MRPDHVSNRGRLNPHVGIVLGGTIMARTQEHQRHLNTQTAFNNCRECRADTERRFVETKPWTYQFVHDYLSFAQPRLNAIRHGESNSNARIWLRDFRKALNRRINLKAGAPRWRKLCDSYLERLEGMRRAGKANATYLRRFAQSGASALDA